MSEHNSGWIGVDLDGTLACYEGWQGETRIGEPIPKMLKRVQSWLKQGRDVRIFTARVWAAPGCACRPAVIESIEEWCVKHIGIKLPITNQKDYQMIELWDDRAVQVIPNTGITMEEWSAANAKLASEQTSNK